MELFEKLLNKSNSYVYYKKQFEDLNESQKKLEKKNKNLISELKNRENQIEKLQNQLAFCTKKSILKKVNNEEYSDLTISIKTPNPKKQRYWGDYFFALALKKSFQRYGFNVFIQEREDWYNNDIKADINIVLRGIIEYKPNFDEINIMWNISHPDLVTPEEYELYDICFISSEKYAIELNDKVNTIVKPLLQCTDSDVFYPSKQDSIAEEILFVGITRGVYRQIIKDVMQTDFDVSIYGKGWDGYVDEKHYKGKFIPNSELHKYYSSCKILLNDHWEDMRDWDFPSNRLFDALACGAFVISDKIPSAETLFEGNIVTYDDVDDLNKKIEYYLNHDEKRKEKAQKGQEIVLKNHTFDNRVETIIDTINNLKFNKYLSLNSFPYDFDQKIILNQLTQKISIIIPIYNAYDDLKKCIDSIFKYTNGNYELILINDNSPDDRIKKYLDYLHEEYENIKVIHNESNKGFVENVNIGIKNSTKDVILLNSDTIVTPKWLQKLIISAYLNINIGTVTPVSNNSGAFSVPLIGKNNEIPNGLGINGMANLVEKSSKRIFMEVPTGNGFCLYIKRELINDVGLFDVENFGKGYGEENDYCMRAIQKGWLNVIDDTTYIYHKGSASFSDKKEKLIKKHRELIDIKHPTYTQEVKNFLSSDKLKLIGSRVSKNMNKLNETKLNKQNILFVLHGGSGGTLYNTNDLMSFFEKFFNCYLLVSNGIEMILYSYNDSRKTIIEKWKLNSKWVCENVHNDEFSQIYFYIIINYSIDLIHIQHLIHHTFDLPKISKYLGIPTVLSLHDFYFICLSHNLINGSRKYCEGKCDSDIKCSDLMGLSEYPVINYYIDTWRENVKEMFSYIDLFITPSDTSKEVYCNFYQSISDKIQVIAHGKDIERINEKLYEIPSIFKPIKIIFIGNLYLQKGIDIIKELNDLDIENKLELHFLGKTDEEIKDIGIHHGEYERENLIKHIKKIKPSFIGIFSIWPETFCYTLTEAWECKIPVLISKIGILEERMNHNDGGWFIDYNNMENTYNLILEIANNQQEYLSKVKNIETYKFKSVDDMGNEYLKNFEELLLRNYNVLL